jgi:PIN domain nuclease of toxin-antitoxin system
MSRLILDSHVLLWWAGEQAKLSTLALESIADPSTEIFVSAASIWELGLKRARGKLNTPDDYLGLLRQSRFLPLAVTMDHSLKAYALPPIHKDLFDRMLVAQAFLESATLVTADTILADYGISVLAA